MGTPRSQQQQQQHRRLSETTPTVIKCVATAPGGGGGGGERNHHQQQVPTTTTTPKTRTVRCCLSESGGKSSSLRMITSTNNNSNKKASSNLRSGLDKSSNKANFMRNLRPVTATRNRNSAFDSTATATATSSSSSWSSPRSTSRGLRSTATTSAAAAPVPLLRVSSWTKVKDNTDKILSETSDSLGSSNRTSHTPSTAGMEDETESLYSFSSSVDWVSQVPHDSSSSSQSRKVLLGRFKRAATRVRKGVGNMITGGGKVDNDGGSVVTNHKNNKQRQSLRCLHHIVLIQAQMRGFLARKAYRKQVQAIITIQSLIRAMKPQLKFKMRMLKRKLKQLEKAKRRDLKHIARQSERVELAIRNEAKKAYNIQQVTILKQTQQKAEKAAALIKALQSQNKKLRIQGKHLEEECTAQVDLMLDAFIANADQTLSVLREIETAHEPKMATA